MIVQPRPLRAAFVESYPQATAGQQRTLAAILAAWVARGHAATVALPADGPVRSLLEPTGADIQILPQPNRMGRYGGAVYRDGPLAKLATAAAAGRYAFAARRWLRDVNADVLFCNDARGWLTFGPAAKSAGVPVIHWDKLDKPHGRGGWLDRLELPLCDRVLFISEAVKAKFPPAQLARYADRCRTVPNGIDPDRFDPAVTPAAAADRDRFGLEEQDFVVAQVGTVCERKGVDRTLAAVPAVCGAHPAALFAFLGEPENDGDAAWRDGLPNARHPRVQWLGQRDDAAGLLNVADAFVLPSRREGMGRAIVEAMACRLPCVGSDAGGIPEVIADGMTGFVVNFADESAGAAALAARLSELAGDPDLRRTMGEDGRQRMFARFHGPTQIAEVIGEIEALAARRRARG